MGCAKFKNAVGVIPIIFQRLAFNGKHGRATRSNGGGSVVLRAENIARCPAHLRTQRLQGFNQHGSLNRHVQAARNACAFKRLGFGKLFTYCHKARHLCLGNGNFLAPPASQINISNGAMRCNTRCIGIHTDGSKKGIFDLPPCQTLRGEKSPAHHTATVDERRCKKCPSLTPRI